MRFAKKIARNLKNKANKGEKRGVKQYMRARENVKQSYVNYYMWEHLTRRETLRNLSACFLYVMIVHHGFGYDRLHKLRDKMQSEFDAIVSQNVSVDEIADFLRTEIGLDVGVQISDTKDRQRQIEERGVREMSSAFLMALVDEFGFRKKRLSDTYWEACELSDMVGDGRITYKEIRQKVEVKMNGKGRNRAGKVQDMRGKSERAVC